jgi:Na+/melibiose symporter-like transporter
MEEREPLSRSVKIAYALPRGTTQAMGLLLQTTVRSLVYVEAFGMAPKLMAMLIALSKSLDLIIGFVVGHASDRCNTSWGRRKPFIMAGFPIWTIIMVLLFNPPSSFKAQRSNALIGEGICDGLQTNESTSLASSTAGSNCPETLRCALKAQANGLLPLSNDTWSGDAITGQPSNELTLWFAVLYFGFYSVGYSCTIIPYDALGMELTDDYDARTELFGYKALSQFSGYLLMGVLVTVFGMLYEDDIAQQMLYMSIIFAVIMPLSFVLLLACVKERREGHAQAQSLKMKKRPSSVPAPAAVEVEPIVPAVQSLLFNKPYINYLWMKVPISIASLVPVSMLAYLVKFVQKEENPSISTGIVTIVVVLSAIIFCPITMWAAKKYGKVNTLLCVCAIETVAHVAVSFMPLNSFSILFLGFVVGIGYIGCTLIPDALLADVIDYDELHTGQRSEGRYTVVETNLQQLVEIPSGVIPLLVIDWLGYEANGGCSCGCGLQCASDILRWNCPGNIGYACGNNFKSQLLDASSAADEFAPCTVQNDSGKAIRLATTEHVKHTKQNRSRCSRTPVYSSRTRVHASAMVRVFSLYVQCTRLLATN